MFDWIKSLLVSLGIIKDRSEKLEDLTVDNMQKVKKQEKEEKIQVFEELPHKEIDEPKPKQVMKGFEVPTKEEIAKIVNAHKPKTEKQKMEERGYVRHGEGYVHKDAKVHPSVKLDYGARVHSGEVCEGTTVGYKAEVSGNAFVGKGCYLGQNCVVRDKCRLEENVHLNNGSIIEGCAVLKNVVTDSRSSNKIKTIIGGNARISGIMDNLTERDLQWKSDNRGHVLMIRGAKIKDDVEIEAVGRIRGTLYDNVKVKGHSIFVVADLRGNAEVHDDCWVVGTNPIRGIVKSVGYKSSTLSVSFEGEKRVPVGLPEGWVVDKDTIFTEDGVDLSKTSVEIEGLSYSAFIDKVSFNVTGMWNGDRSHKCVYLGIKWVD